MPAFPPVTTMTLPVRSGMSDTPHFGFGGMCVRFARTNDMAVCGRMCSSRRKKQGGASKLRARPKVCGHGGGGIGRGCRTTGVYYIPERRKRKKSRGWSWCRWEEGSQVGGRSAGGGRSHGQGRGPWTKRAAGRKRARRPGRERWKGRRFGHRAEGVRPGIVHGFEAAATRRRRGRQG